MRWREDRERHGVHDRHRPDAARCIARGKTGKAARYGHTAPRETHLDLRAKQHARVFGQGQAPSDEGLIESQPILGLAILPPERTGSVEQIFVDGFRAVLVTVRDRPATWRLIVASDPDPMLAAAIAKGRAQIGAQVSAVMRPLFERWQVADIDRVLPPLTEVFLGICEVAVRMVLDPTPDSAAATPDGLAEIMGRAAYRALRSAT